ncbi:MAG TPA: GDP-mannose 4,6-dehydratase [Thermoleophilaceae bacterium]
MSSEQRRALVTGVTGQDGSYLAELLLEKGYEVHGMVRRASTETFQRLQHIRDRITLHTGDLLDQRSLGDVMRECEPHEIYNLAAMSFVAASWNQPVLTADFTGVGVTRMLEAMREAAPDARFYQASSSEMFGKVREVPQTEQTPFYPRSPYGVAKVYGHFITVNYRESYDLFACSGILFNHECVSSSTPLMVRENGVFAIRTPADLVPYRRRGPSSQTFEPSGLLEIWAGEDWTRVTAITATRRRRTDPDHELLSIETRGGVVQATAHHTMLDATGEGVRAADVEEGDELYVTDELPEAPIWTAVTNELAELLGLLAADGFVARDGTSICFTNNDAALRMRVAQLWSKTFLGTSHEWMGRTGWTENAQVGKLNLNGGASLAPWLREQLYTPTGHKQVPPIILNADSPLQEYFLEGYYAGDGLKRGKGESIKTNSAVLAQGLVCLYHSLDQPASVYVEQRAGKCYYQLNLASRASVYSGKGAHLRKPPQEVRRIIPAEVDDDEWVFDIETEAGVFNAGVGRLVVHNSPRRGLEFVTRKVTHTAAAIKLGLADELALGNMDAQRDWGYAKDYVEAMWMMLQQDEPDDYVIATGEAHSVRELVDIAFAHLDLDPDDYVRIDPRFMRPAEVDHLIGDYSKAKEKLGWEPRTSFEELVKLMVDSDLELLRSGVPTQQAG